MQNWRELKRHPLSEEYADIVGPERYALCLSLRNLGFLSDKKIVLHEGQVLEGWQRILCCIETNTEPEFMDLPEGIDPEAFVRASNDNRRHETPKDREARRKRVAKARGEGQSIRTIAEEEEVSPATIQNDLEKLEEQGDPAKPPKGKVKGKDGKKQKAKKTPVLCRHCEHRKNVGKPLIENCPNCAELRKVLKPKKEKKAPEPKPDLVTDDAGTPVPQRLLNVFRSLPDFKEAERLLNLTGKAFKVIEEGACKDIKTVEGGKHFTKYYGTFRAARARLKAMRPSLVCTVCRGDGGCGSCQDGFLTAEMVGGN